MIQRVTIENFRCFERLSLDLRPVNLVTGKNNVGKTALLEDLCLATIGQHPALDCVERFLRCASEQGLVPADGQLGKARLQAWLAAQARPGRRLGEAARDGLWDLGAPALAALRRFLAELAR